MNNNSNELNDVMEILESALAERIELDEDSNEEQIYTKSVMLESMMNNISTRTEIELISMIPDWTDPDANILSRIFHTFKGVEEIRKTDIPLGIPIFSFITFLAAKLVKENARYIRPTATIHYDFQYTRSEKIDRVEKLNLWMLLLADSGDSKTLTVDIIKKATDTVGDITKVNSALMLAQSLSENPNGLWINDEFGQLWEQMQGKSSEDSNWKSIFLQAKDGETEWKSKATQIPLTKLSISALLINTEKQFNKATSDESLVDGMARRFNIAYVVEESLKDDFNNITIPKDEIIDAISNPAKHTFQIASNFKDAIFEFEDGCYAMTNTVYKLAKTLYGSSLNKAFIKTYLNESYKFAIYMHIIQGNSDVLIKKNSMQYGLAMSLLLLDSFKKFLERRINYERPSPNINNRHKLTALPKNIHTKTNSILSATTQRINKIIEKELVLERRLEKREVRRMFPQISKEDYQDLWNIYQKKTR